MTNGNGKAMNNGNNVREGELVELAVKALIAYGARLVLTRGKNPGAPPKQAFEKGWLKDIESPTTAKVLGHLKRAKNGIRHGFSVIPASLGCVVIDVDHSPKESDLTPLFDKIGEPIAKVKSPNGFHLYYRKTDEPIANKNWEYNGLSGELRADGGACVCWQPEVLVQGYKKNFGNAHAISLSDIPIAKLKQKSKDGAWEKGNRNNTLYDKVRRATILDNPEAVEKAVTAARNKGLPDDEIQATKESAIRAGQEACVNCLRERMARDKITRIFDDYGITARYNNRLNAVEFKPIDADEWAWQPPSDRMIGELRDRIQAEYTIAHTKDVLKPFKLNRTDWDDAINSFVFDKEVDPFIAWVESLPAWDGTERIDFLLTTLFEAQATSINMWASRYPFVGAIQRGYDPGCQLREMPILIGRQNMGKSAFIKHLLPAPARELWYSDNIDVSAKYQERVEALLGPVFVEFAELAGYTRADINALKAFITHDVDRVRLPYRYNREAFPRRCVFIGTTNDVECLPNDPTGNTRYVPVSLEAGCNIEKHFAPNEYREQLWAEALSEYHKGTRANLPRNLIEKQAELTEKARRKDHSVEDAVSNITLTEGTTLELAIDCGIESLTATTVSSQHARRFTTALSNNGWVNKRRRVEGRREYLWVRN